jgi:hypothetical protein
MKKQTAVEWLMEQVYSDEYIYAFGRTYISIELISKAIEKERNQIIAANEDCSTNELGELFTGEQYYNETYGN